MKHLLKNIALAALLLGQSRALRAADEGSFIFPHPHNARALYELVFNPELNGKKKGIYFFNTGAENSTPLIQKEVLGVNKRSAETFALLAPVTQQGNQEALVILDGQIYIVNKNTSEKKVASALIIGANESQKIPNKFATPIPIIDPLTKRKIYLENIKDPKDITIVQYPVDHSCMYIVSVKQGIPQMGSDGITFAFVKNGGHETGEFKISEPVLLDYRFHPTDQGLIRLFVDYSPDKAYSPYLLKTVYEKWKNDKEHPLVDVWLKKIKLLLDYLDPNSKIDKKTFTSRYRDIDINSGKSLKLGVNTNPPLVSVIEKKPEPQVSNMAISGVTQVFEPLGDGLSFQYEGSPPQKGRLSWDQDNKKFLTRSLSPDSSVEVLFSLDKSILLRLKSRNRSIQVVEVQDQFSKLKFDPFNNDNVIILDSFDLPQPKIEKRKSAPIFGFSDNTPDDELISGAVYKKHYLILSGKTQHYPEGATFAIELEESMGHVSVKDTQILSNKCNFSREELELRIKTIENLGLVFDNSTPRVGPKTYKSDSQKNSGGLRVTAYLNVSETDPKKKTVFLQAKNEFTIIRSPNIVYREFNNDKQSQLNEKTGVYIEDTLSEDRHETPGESTSHLNKDDSSFIPGQLIYSNSSKTKTKKNSRTSIANDSIRAVLYTTDIHLPLTENSKQLEAFKIHLFGMLPNNSQQPNLENKFNLVTLFNYEGRVGENIKNTFFATRELPFSFSQIEGVRVFKGLRNHANSIYVMLFLKRTRQNTGGVYLLGYELKSQLKAGKIEFTANNIPDSSGWLTKSYVTANRISDRVLPDGNGALYWVDTPNEDYFSAKYKMRCFNYVSKLVIPSKENINIRLKERIVQENEKEGRLFWIGSRWSISSSTGLRSINSTLSKALDGNEADQAKTYKDLNFGPGGKGPLYPLLDDYLDSLVVDPSKKGKKTFLVVSDEDYANFYNLMLLKLDHKKTGWSLKWKPGGNDFELYFFDHQSDAREMRKELKLASESTTQNVLFAGSDELLQTFILESDGKNSDDSDSASSFSILDYASSDSERQMGIETVSDQGDPETKGSSKKTENNEDDEDENDGTNKGAKHKHEEDEPEVVETSHGGDELDEESFSESARSTSSDHIYDPSSPHKLSGLFLLATEGKGRHLKDLSSPSDSYKSVTTVVLTTPKKLLKLQEAHPHEFKAGLVDKGLFEIDARFLTSQWYNWPPNTPRSTPDIRRMSVSALTSDDLQVFPNLRPILSELSKKPEKPKHRIIVVPENIKKLMLRFLMTHWSSRYNVALERDANGNPNLNTSWNFRNPHLSIFRYPQGGKVLQEEIFGNLDAMRRLSQENSVVLLADASDLLRNERPLVGEKSDIKPFRISDPAAMKKTELLAETASEAQSNASSPIEANEKDGNSASRSDIDKPNTIFPHIMWWLASEGRRIQPKLKKQWRLRDEATPSVSEIIVATPEQIEDLEKDLGLESHFMDLQKDFEIVRLEYPSVEHRSNILRNLFYREDIRTLNYSFRYNGNESGAERNSAPFLNITKFLANRIEAVANSLNQEPIEAFVRSYSIFRKSLVDDHKLRRSRVIDENYVERFLAKVFPIPLNYKSLEPEDVLHKIKDTARAAVDLTKLGYAGQLDLKERIFRLILSQTQGSDSSKQIPSSAVFFGETSLGKTFFFEKLIQLLDIKVYDFNRPLDENAQAFFLKVEDLVDKKEEATGKSLYVEDALKHLDNFLSLPLGYRGFILIDDLHKAKNANVLSRVMSYIQNLLNNNLVRVSRLEDKMTIEIPVRNISLFVTINPASNREIRDQYIDDASSIESQIIAALSQVEGAQYEPSILARFSDLINFGDFPREAKASGLISKIRARSLQELTLSNKLILVNPHILSEIAQIFPKAHARNFLMPVTNSLFTEAKDDSLAPAPLYYVTSSKSDTHDSKDLQDDWNVDEWYNEDHQVEDGGSTINSTTLRNQIKKHVVVKPVTFDNLRGRLDFAEFNSNSFRINFYNHFINSIQNHKFFRASLQNEMYYLKPLITGVYLNLRNRPELRFWNLDLSPVRLKIHQHSGFLSEFQDLMDAHHNSKPVIPFKLPASSVLERDSLDDFLKIKGSIQEQEGQREYISRLIINIESLMKNLFYKFYQSNGFQESNSQVWLDSMKNSKEVREEFASTTDKIRDLFQMFVSNQGFLNPKLKEVQKGLHSNLSSSDLAIIFLWAIDQAIANLPWDNANVFMMKMLEEIIDEPALSTRSEFAEFAFKTEESPLSPLTVEYVTQLLEGNDLIRDKVPELERNHAGFGERCEYLLISEDKK